MLFLVRHGLPLIDRQQPASAWHLDPAGFDAVWALRDRLPQGAAWYSSPEAKAVQTAQLLTDTEVGVVEGLCEHVRDSTDWLDDFQDVVRRAFADPTTSAYDGWEPLVVCRSRVVAATRPILAAHAGEDVVLVGHGTAWTVLAGVLEDREPDLDRWSLMGLPDVVEVDPG